MKYIFNESKHKINQSDTKFMVLIGTFVDTPILGELRIRKNCCLGVDLRSVDEDGKSNGKRGRIVFIKENSSNVNDPILDAYEYDSNLQEMDITNIEIIETNKKTEGEKNCQFYFPGFIDTHCHASQYPNAGIFGNTTLLDWLNKYTFPLEQSLVDLTIAHQVYGKVLQKTISHGTTCVAYYATLDSKSTLLLAEVCKQYGQRAFIGKVCMDRNSPDFYKETLEESIKSVHEVLKYIKNMNNHHEILVENNEDTKSCGNIDRIQPILTPRFAPACTDSLMKYLGDLSIKENLLIQTHLSENLNEIQWVENLYPDLPNYTAVYDHFNILHEKTILAHCIHLSESEIELIKKRKSKVSHCPISNTAITSGKCKVRTLLDNGIDVSLGTDLSGGYSSSILHTAKHAVLVSRHLAMKDDCQKSKVQEDNKEDEKRRNHYKLSTQEALYLGTMGGAKCLGLDNIIGSFEVGKEFDCQMIDLNVEDSNVDVFAWQYCKPPTVDAMRASIKKCQDEDEEYEKAFTDLIDKWLYNGDDRNTVKVWIQGLLVKTNS